MSQNRFMHPRNKYKKPPDFKALAIKYPEFRKYAKQDISGKVSLNFKDLESVRALTCTLLKEDFDLDVEIPLSRLIPTLPLRLNYLLWLEDIMEINPKASDIKGIDIGCGASCVYPLLAAKHFHWHMLATEVDLDSAFIASRNVMKNNLKDMITVRSVSEDSMLSGVLEPDTVYDFCMCNPPFFSSVEELDPQVVSRSPARPPPRNAHSGALRELVVSGGEMSFITKIIQDSVKLKSLIRVYSVMVGHKTSVNKVKQALHDAGVTQVMKTEFCQGHTTRWGVAWTLDPNVKLVKAKRLQSTSKKTFLSHTFEADLPTTVQKLHQVLDKLQMTYTLLKNNPELCAMEITAMTNTWSNSRKKRRQEKFKLNTSKDITSIETEDCKKSLDKDGNKELQKNGTKLVTSNQRNDEMDSNGSNENENSKPREDLTIEKVKSEYDDQSALNKDGTKRIPIEESDSSDSIATKRLKIDINSKETNIVDKNEPFLNGSLVVKKGPQGSVVELCWLRGIGGRDAAHQVLQFFKNNLTTH